MPITEQTSAPVAAIQDPGVAPDPAEASIEPGHLGRNAGQRCADLGAISSRRRSGARRPSPQAAGGRAITAERSTSVGMLDRGIADASGPHRWIFVGEGLVLMALGIAAISMPIVSTMAVELFVGWLVFAGGVIRVNSLIGAARPPGFWWSMAAALVAIVLGLALALMPLAGVLALTMLLVALFVSEGVAALATGFYARQHFRGWPWLLLSGLLNLALAFLIASGWPDSAGWTIGVITGASLEVIGLSLALL